jgi:anti-sigma factor RsiW
MLTCNQTRPLLAGFADGELQAVEREAVAAHLETCGRCRQRVLDQQHVQHVLESYTPPAVGERQWTAIGKRLRSELEGTGLKAVLKTRARVESLGETPVEEKEDDEQTPVTAAGLPASLRPPTPRTGQRPTALPLPGTTAAAAHAKRRRVRHKWVAHLVGALAASVILIMGLALLWETGTPPLPTQAMALQKDVKILDVQMLDPDYTVVLNVGDADDVAGIWVIPADASTQG